MHIHTGRGFSSSVRRARALLRPPKSHREPSWTPIAGDAKREREIKGGRLTGLQPLETRHTRCGIWNSNLNRARNGDATG